jgi:hypothetical protein
MIGPGAGARVMVATRPVDFRKGPDALAALQYLDARLRQLSTKSKLAEAIHYALTRWNGLTLFLDDGRVELESNTVERSIRPLALNRKNALLAGSDEGGDNWAVIATLIENCKLSGINPHAWLSEVSVAWKPPCATLE